MTRVGWVHAAILLAIGMILWFVVPPLLAPPTLATIVMIIGIIMTVVGAILLVAALVGGVSWGRNP